jgi:hypothetical protein
MESRTKPKAYLISYWFCAGERLVVVVVVVVVVEFAAAAAAAAAVVIRGAALA